MRKRGFVRLLSGLLALGIVIISNQAGADAPACAKIASGWPGPVDFCAMLGDTNGDGSGLPIVFSGGTWVTSNDEFDFGAALDRPVVGDWDGDGDVSAGLLTPNYWIVHNQFGIVTGAGVIDSQGLLGVPVSGDWDGDGQATLGHYIDGTWVLSNTNVQEAVTDGLTTFTLQFGAPNMLPLVGDWNGDGIADFGLYDGVSFYLSNGPSPDMASAQTVTPNPPVPGAIPVAGHLGSEPGFYGLLVFVPEGDPLPAGVVDSLPGSHGSAGDAVIIIEID